MESIMLRLKSSPHIIRAGKISRQKGNLLAHPIFLQCKFESILTLLLISGHQEWASHLFSSAMEWERRETSWNTHSFFLETARNFHTFIWHPHWDGYKRRWWWWSCVASGLWNLIAKKSKALGTLGCAGEKIWIFTLQHILEDFTII